MAKKGFEVSGRMTVDTFENLFLQSFFADIIPTESGGNGSHSTIKDSCESGSLVPFLSV